MNRFCTKCGLYQTAKNPCIWGRGNPESKVLFLGEAPGEKEDEQNSVFVGRAGQLLQFHLNNFGVDHFISNVVRCRPKDEIGKNRTPLPTELSCCKPFTIKLINEMKPKVIVAMGKIPMQQLLGFTMDIETARGKVYYHPQFNASIIVTYHPAFLLRSNESMHARQFQQDIALAGKIVFEPLSRKILSLPITIENPVQIEKYLRELITCDVFAFDLETSGRDFKKDRITDISFASQCGKGVHIKWENILPYYDLLKEVMASNVKKVTHNGSFDIKFMRSVGIPVSNHFFDTMLAYHTLTMSYAGSKAESLYKLKTLAWLFTAEGGYESVLDEFGGIAGTQAIKHGERRLPKKSKGEPKKPSVQYGSLFISEVGAEAPLPRRKRILSVDTYTDEDLETHEKFIDNKRKECLEQLQLTPLQYYSAMDADITYRVYKTLLPKIEKDYKEIYNNIVMPVSNALIRLEETGIKIDVDYIKKVSKVNEKKMEDVKAEFFKKVGYTINLNSSQQMSDLLYNKLKLPINTRFLTGKKKAPSTDSAALQFFSEKKPVLKLLLEYRELTKQTSSFLTGYLDLVDQATGRVYPSYFQLTATGRLSCRKPNIQQIPGDNKIRNMIIPETGWKLLSADLSQIELRILAMVSGDKAMINAFRSGMDFHTATACNMFNIKPEDFDKSNPSHKDKRTVSKTINFGVIYQESPKSLSERLGITEREAESFINKFFRAYPDVKNWMDDTRAFVKRKGYVETLYGRRRYLPSALSSDEYAKAEALRMAVNTPIQSTASDICCMALVKFQNWVDKENMKSRPVGIIHDCILAEAPEDEIEKTALHLVEFMTQNIPKVTGDIKVDLEILDRWAK